jgi:hypothetical protein
MMRRRAGTSPGILDSLPLLAAEGDDCRGEDTVLFLEDVTTQHDQNLLQPVRPALVSWNATGSFAEDAFDLPVLTGQCCDLVGVPRN